MTTWCIKTRSVSPISSGESLHKGCIRVPSGTVKLLHKPVWIACFTVPYGGLHCINAFNRQTILMCRAFPSEAAVQVGLVPETPAHMHCLHVAHAAASIAA